MVNEGKKRWKFLSAGLVIVIAVIRNLKFFNPENIYPQLFLNKYTIILGHVASFVFLYGGMMLLDCQWMVYFPILCMEYLILNPSISLVPLGVHFSFFLSACLVKLARQGRRTHWLVLFIGIYAGLITWSRAEFVFVAIFCFFSVLFVWLTTHNIGEYNKQFIDDSLITFSMFVVGFLLTFFGISSFSGFPKRDDVFYGFRELILRFDPPYSIVCLASIPSALTHQYSPASMIMFAALLAAEMYLVLYIQSPGVGVSIVREIRKAYLDIFGIVASCTTHSVACGTISTFIVFPLEVITFFKSLKGHSSI